MLNFHSYLVLSFSKSSLLPQYYKPVSTGQVRQISKKEYQFPELNEKDLKESFTLGSGPGGQSVQTTSNCVRLTHLPTGISVKVPLSGRGFC